MTSLTTYCSIANISDWSRAYMFTTRLLWRDPYYVSWYILKVNWL